MIRAPVTLKFTLGLSMLLIALGGVGLLVISIHEFRSSSRDAEESSLGIMLDLQTDNVLNAVETELKEFGSSLQARSAFRTHFANKDYEQVQSILQSQFRQQLFTSGTIELQTLALLDLDFNVLTEASQAGMSGPSAFCSELLATARQRTGPAALKPLAELCSVNGRGHFQVLTTVGGFRPIGYLLTVVDPSRAILDVEKVLGDPVQISHIDGSISARATSWPGELSDRLLATYPLRNQTGEKVFTVTAAHDQKIFEEQLSKSIYRIFASAALVFVPSLALAVFILFRGLSPLTALQKAVEKLRTNSYEKITVKTYSEFESLIKAFNQMAESITREIAERKDAEQRAEAANRGKSTFLANMSHEIRTPMNAVLGYAQILLRDGGLSDKQLKAVETIDKSGNHLLALINEILDISKIEAGRMEVIDDSFDLVDLAHDLSAMFQLRCQQKGLRWRVDVLGGSNSACVRGDPGKIRQVLINLLGNAVKFTDDGEVVFTINKLSTEQYLFEVQDSGVGITATAQANIFDAFFQSDEGTKKGGTGLGLAIANKQVELMGGKLLVDSSPGMGARFYFVLTLLPAAADAVKSVPAHLAMERLKSGERINALIVDDVSENRDVLRQLLEQVGVSCVEAEDGMHAVEMALANPPQVIFMDYRMPRMNGVEAMQKIKTTYGDKVKVFMVSASVYDQDRKKFFDAGCDEILAKPIRIENIVASLKQLGMAEFTQANVLATPKAAPVAKSKQGDPISLPESFRSKFGELIEMGLVLELEDTIGELTQQCVLTAENAAAMRAALARFDMVTLKKLVS